MNIIIIFSVVKNKFHMIGMYCAMLSGIVCVFTAMKARTQSKEEDIDNPYKFRKDGNYHHLYAHFVAIVVHTILCIKLASDCDSTEKVFCGDAWM
jgi:hypothetical protein